MSDSPFERDLTAMFAEVPRASDADAFVLAFERKLEQHLRRRRLILGAFTATGVALSGFIIVETGGLQRLMTGLSADVSTSIALSTNPIVLAVACVAATLAGLAIARPPYLSIPA